MKLSLGLGLGSTTQPAQVSEPGTLLASTGYFNLSGQNVADLPATLIAETGTFNLSGQAAQKVHNRLLSSNQGVYTLSGQDATLTEGGGGSELTDTRLFMAGRLNARIYQYDNPTTTKEIDDFNYDTNFVSTSGEDTSPNGLSVKPDGTKMWVVGGDKVIDEYTLSTAHDITSATYARSYAISSNHAAVGNTKGFFVKPDGTKFFIADASNAEIHEFTVSTGWDLTSTITLADTVDVSANETSPSGVALSSDGLSCIYIGNDNDEIHQMVLSSAYDLSSVSSTGSLDVSSQSTGPNGICYSSDDLSIYITEGSGTLYEYTTSTNTLIASYSYSGRSLDVSNEDNNIQDLFMVH